MTPWTLILVLLVAVDDPEGHRANPVYQSLRKEGWVVGKTVVAFPEPSLADDLTADQEREALRAITGSERAVAEFTRDSVTAPFVLKSTDLKAESGAIVRQAALWFVVRASLDQIDPDPLAAGSEGKEIEVGNMRFSSRRLSEAERAARKLPSVARGDLYVHSSGVLLDRIAVSSTARITTSRTPGSRLIASRNEPKLDADPDLPNQWTPNRRGEGLGEPRVYAGGASLVKITELKSVPGALLVEARFAFEEPKDWFDGAPILRSKFSLIAQDRIRALRRELAGKASR